MGRSIRTLHRWVSPVFALAVLASLVFTAAGGSEDSPVFLALGVVVVGAILTLLVTGTVMFVQHYAPRRRGARTRPSSSRRAA